MSRIPEAVADEVIVRANGYCEACGWPERGKMDLHHRKKRGIGGTTAEDLDTAINLMWVHFLCHNMAAGSIHMNPARSYRVGHLVYRGIDPASVEVQIVDMGLRA